MDRPHASGPWAQVGRGDIGGLFVSQGSSSAADGSKSQSSCKLMRWDREITVHQSPGSRDYNIEGTAELTLEPHTAGRPETTGRMLFFSSKW